MIYSTRHDLLTIYDAAVWYSQILHPRDSSSDRQHCSFVDKREDEGYNIVYCPSFKIVSLLNFKMICYSKQWNLNLKDWKVKIKKNIYNKCFHNFKLHNFIPWISTSKWKKNYLITLPLNKDTLIASTLHPEKISEFNATLQCIVNSKTGSIYEYLLLIKRNILLLNRKFLNLEMDLILIYIYICITLFILHKVR